MLGFSYSSKSISCGGSTALGDDEGWAADEEECAWGGGDCPRLAGRGSTGVKANELVAGIVLDGVGSVAVDCEASTVGGVWGAAGDGSREGPYGLASVVGNAGDSDGGGAREKSRQFR